jgi:hypothetical protein
MVHVLRASIECPENKNVVIHSRSNHHGGRPDRGRRNAPAAEVVGEIAKPVQAESSRHRLRMDGVVQPIAEDPIDARDVDAGVVDRLLTRLNSKAQYRPA